MARALARIPQEDRRSYAALCKWFQQNAGVVGSRHLGELLPGVDFKHAAQRGIHAPPRAVRKRRGRLHVGARRPPKTRAVSFA